MILSHFGGDNQRGVHEVPGAVFNQSSQYYVATDRYLPHTSFPNSRQRIHPNLRPFVALKVPPVCGDSYKFPEPWNSALPFACNPQLPIRHSHTHLHIRRIYGDPEDVIPMGYPSRLNSQKPFQMVITTFLLLRLMFSGL